MVNSSIFHITRVQSCDRSLYYAKIQEFKNGKSSVWSLAKSATIVVGFGTGNDMV
jgi:hypothetical protein